MRFYAGTPKRLLILVILAGLLVPLQAHAATVVVNQEGPAQGWTSSVAGGSSGQFVAGPAVPPLGAGSYRQAVTASSDSHVLGTIAGAGTALSAITALSYSTYVEQHQNGQAPVLKLFVDTDGNGTADDTLNFEPIYQRGTYPMVPGAAAIPNQCGGPFCATTGTWQTWDAKAGGWWATSAMTAGPPLDTLAHYASTHPGAKLAQLSQFAVGFGVGSGWTSYAGSVDAFNMGISGATTTYDFEAGPVVTVVVYPQQLHGWSSVSQGTGAGEFVSGPGSVPAGLLGSFRQRTPAANDRNFLETGAFSGIRLVDIHHLSYATLTASSGSQAPVVQLYLDLDGDGFYTGQANDDILMFEPANQTGGFPMVSGAGSVPNQCGGPCTPTGVWKTWNAARGAWTPRSSATFPGPPYDTLSHYAATHPGAKIAAATPEGLGGVRIASGSSGTAWVGFSGNTDYLRFNDTVYDFEPASLDVDCDAITDDIGAIQGAVNAAPSGSTIRLTGVCDFTGAPAHGGDITSIVTTAVLIRPGAPVTGLTITSGATQATILGSGTQAAFTIAPGNDGTTIRGLRFVNLGRAIVTINTDNTTIGALGSMPDPAANRIIGGPTSDSAVLGLSIDRNPATAPGGTITLKYGPTGASSASVGAGSGGLRNYKVYGNYITYDPPGLGAPDVVAIDVRERFGRVVDGVTIKGNAVGMLTALFPSINMNAVHVHSLSPTSGSPTGTLSDYFIRNVTIEGNNFGRLEELPNPVADINAAGRLGIHLQGVGNFTIAGNGVRTFLTPTAIPMPGGGIVVNDSAFGRIAGNGINVLAEPSTLHSDMGAIGVIDDLNVVFADPPKPQQTRDIVIEGNTLGTIDPNTSGINQRGIVVTKASGVTARANTIELTTANAINIAPTVQGPGNAGAPGIVTAPVGVTASTFCGNSLDGTTDDPDEVWFGEAGTAGSIANSFPTGSLFSGNGECVAPAVVLTQTGGSTTATEGGAGDTYTVSLSYRPAANVTVTVSPDAQVSAAPTTLTFTPLTWKIGQPVAVNAVDDLLVEGGHFGVLSHTVSSTDPAYNAIAAPSLTVSITDNDLGQILFTPGAVNVAEGGATDTYSVVLTAPPPVPVTVLTSNVPPQVSMSPASLSFTPGNWSLPQTVTVTAIDDSYREGPHVALIKHSLSSTNSAWNGSAAAVTANITDNDGPPAPVVFTPGNGAHVCTSSLYVNGTAEAGSTVEIREGATLLGTAAVPAGGFWIAGPFTFAPGTHTINIRVVGADSLVSATVTRTFEIDTTAPAAPVITQPVGGSTVSTVPVVVKGTADPGTVVYVRVNGVSIATGHPDATGQWTTYVRFTSGVRTIDAVAADCLMSAPSAPVTFTVDLPDPPTITLPAQNAITPAQVTVSGTSGSGTTVTLKEGPLTLAQNLPVTGGTWTTTLSLTDGLHSIVAYAVTPGATSEPSAVRTFRVDASPPTIKIRKPAGYVLAQILTPLDDLAVFGTANDNVGVDHVELTYHPLLPLFADEATTATCSGCPAASVSWADHPPLLPGVWFVKAVAVDRAGNRSAEAADILIVLTF